MTIDAVAKSDPGLVREINEDSVMVLQDQGLVILADGMGGYNAGEVASQLVVEHITSQLLPSLLSDESYTDGELVGAAVESANEAILVAVDETPEYQGMATTVAMGVFVGDVLHYAHVGDSRVYRFRQGKLLQLTRDHSMIEALIDEGMFETVEEAEKAGVKKNVLVRGLGIAPEVDVDVGEEKFESDDIYLFCSDGLCNMVSDEEIESILIHKNNELAVAAEQLLTSALEYGGLDNISLALARPGIGI